MLVMGISLFLSVFVQKKIPPSHTRSPERDALPQFSFAFNYSQVAGDIRNSIY